MKTIMLFLIAASIMTGCKTRVEEADAFGNFEATEVIISAETTGRILQSDITEGMLVEKGARLAIIDTTFLHLQIAEIDAGIRSVSTRLASINAQNGILEQQIENINKNVSRIGNMLKDDAATRKQYDDLTGQIEVLKRQVTANNTQKASVSAEISVLEAKRAIAREQASRSTILSPLSGTVTGQYMEAGEMAAIGKPLAKIADMSVMRLKAYVDGGQLGSIKTGQQCRVRIDEGETGYRSYNAVISHISEKAEFTPKIIQTKKERVTLVYAVTADVTNDGSLKAGMPGEIIFD